MESFRERICKYIKTKYCAVPEHPWLRYPEYTIFRHQDNEKWFGLIMNVSRVKLGLNGVDEVDILNVKLSDPMLADLLIGQAPH